MKPFPFILNEIEVHPLNIINGVEYLVERTCKNQYGSHFIFTKFYKVWYGYTFSVGSYSEQMNYEWERAKKDPNYYDGHYDEKQNLKTIKRIWKVIRTINWESEKPETIDNPLLDNEDVEIP